MPAVESIILPQKIYFRRAAFHTVVGEVTAKKVVLISTFTAKEQQDYVAETLRQKNGTDVFVVNVPDIAPTNTSITAILDNIAYAKPETIVAVGSTNIAYHAAAALESIKYRPEFVLIATDGKPLPLMTKKYRFNNELKESRNVIPDFIVLDSGIAKPSGEDVQACVKCAVSDSIMNAYCDEVRKIGGDLMKCVEPENPVWRESATNLVGILMLSIPKVDLVMQHC